MFPDPKAKVVFKLLVLFEQQCKDICCLSPLFNNDLGKFLILEPANVLYFFSQQMIKRVDD